MIDPATLPQEGRATPPCPHFGPCGGCQLQQLAYPAQLALKADRLRTLLGDQGLSLPDSAADGAASGSYPEIQLHPSPPFAYRNRIRLTLAEVAGKLHAGYLTSGNKEPATNSGQPSFLPITQCPIAAPILWRAAEALLDQIDSAAAVWLQMPQIKLDQLEIFTTADECGLQFTLFLRSAAKSLPAPLATAFNALCESIRQSIPELIGASIACLPTASSTRSRRNEVPRPGPTWGAPGLLYPIPQLINGSAGTTTCWVPRGTFFQVNRYLVPALLDLATSGRSGTLAFDLYAGVGLFSRVLAQNFDRVVAVEAAEPSASALAATKLRNLHAVQATTLDFLRSAVVDRDRPDLIILDPPRTGAGAEICGLLARLAAPTLVYISCSPETLPADLATLAATGYRVSELHLFDLFPQTSHIETVAILTREKT